MVINACHDGLSKSVRNCFRHLLQNISHFSSPPFPLARSFRSCCFTSLAFAYTFSSTLFFAACPGPSRGLLSRPSPTGVILEPEALTAYRQGLVEKLLDQGYQPRGSTLPVAVRRPGRALRGSWLGGSSSARALR